MSFQNPAGLWLLLGVPVLIVIWLIRPPYEKKVVSSTYLWQLSERFMKKHLPLHRLTRWLSFLMQLMLIVGSAFYAAQPVWNHGDRVDYLVILDSTASMQMVNAEGMTRYERAAQQIMTLADETSKGHTISILLASDVPEMILTDAASAADVRTALDSHPCGYGSGSLSQAMPLAQLFMDEHPGSRVMLYTDQTVTETEGLTLVSLNENEWNAAMTGISVQQGTDGKLMVSGVVVSYEQDVEISVGVKVDGVLKDAAAIACAADEPTVVSFIVNASAYETIELYMEPKDVFTSDLTGEWTASWRTSEAGLMELKQIVQMQLAEVRAATPKIESPSVEDAEQVNDLDLHLILGAILLVLMLADIAVRKLKFKRN